MCFIARASLPLKLSAEGFLETIPDLAVEVQSKNDTVTVLERKAGEYLAAGAKLVWAVDSLYSLAVVYQAVHTQETFGLDDQLAADGIIRGFPLKVSDALPA